MKNIQLKKQRDAIKSIMSIKVQWENYKNTLSFINPRDLQTTLSKYNESQEEIDFIETKVKLME